MPVAAIALALIEMVARRFDDGITGSHVDRLLQKPADVHHPRVHRIRFGILDFEVPPHPAAHERLDLFPTWIVFELMNQFILFDLTRNWQRPFGHLPVAAIWQVNFPKRLSLFDHRRQSRRAEPIAILSQRFEEFLQPTFFVNVLFGVGPGSKLFAVVAKHENAARILFRHFAAVSDDFIRLRKWNQVSKLFAAREDSQNATFIFNHIVAIKLIVRQARAAEMIIVQNRIANSCIRDRRRKVRFPNPFRHPHAVNFWAYMFFEPLRELRDLTDAIASWNHRQDGFVKSTANDFDSSGFDQ